MHSSLNLFGTGTKYTILVILIFSPYFSPPNTSDIQLRNTIDCKYLMALSAIGLGDYEKARDGLDEVLALQRNHLGAIEHVRYLEEMGV